MHMWSLASLQRPSRMYALPRYAILHITTHGSYSQLTFFNIFIKYIHHHCLRTAERPTACGTSVQALSSPKSQTSWHPVRTGNISAHRVRVFHPKRASCYEVHIGQRKNTTAAVVILSVSAENAASNALYTMPYTVVYTVLYTRCPYNEVPGSR